MTLKHLFQVDVFNVKRELGIPQEKKVVLVAGGTSGYGIDRRAVGELQKDAVVIVVCGKNAKLHDELVLHSHGNPSLKVYGYVSNMPELYAIADLLVSKPGGLTIAECLQRNLTVLVTSFMPGQEKLNYNYLKQHNLILTDYANVKDELEMKTFNATLPSNPARSQIVQDDGGLIREAVGKTLA
jgi:UDP-N-acetylglucosamine:LPS N-acetylglucosamine transferase